MSLTPTPRRVFDLLPHQLAIRPRSDAFAKRHRGEWVKYSTLQTIEQIDRLAIGLHRHGLRAGDRVANICESGRPEWNWIDHAVLSLGAVHVAIYPDIASEEREFILRDSGAKLLFVSSERLYETVLPFASSVPGLEILGYESFYGIVSIGRIIEEGALALAEPGNQTFLKSCRERVGEDELATLIYTSGTTGRPKGVMLSHRNLMSNVRAAAKLLGMVESDRALSFLPLCHSFERTVTNIYTYLGIGVYYAESFETIGRDLREVRPQIFSAVPRVLEKIYARILARGDELSGIQRRLFKWASGVAAGYGEEPSSGVWHRFQSLLADWLVYRQCRAGLGGAIKGIISGSAALQPALNRTLWGMGIRVYEGYGPTEASPVISSNGPAPGRYRIGTVGAVLEGGEIRIADDGEILYRGPNVMMGYYHLPDITNETIDAEGWLHTGDVGEYTDGFLRITDRKKEIFKTSGGKYIAPQPLENLLKESQLIAQCMVIGENRRFPAALVVPNLDALNSRLRAQGVEAGDLAEAARLPETRRLIEADVARCNAHFGRYSQIKKFVLLGAEWTIASGELTPTLKLKRKNILNHHAEEIEALYVEDSRSSHLDSVPVN